MPVLGINHWEVSSLHVSKFVVAVLNTPSLPTYVPLLARVKVTSVVPL
jgi:hypothetical protein